MKKTLKSRFQKLAGIKPIREQDDPQEDGYEGNNPYVWGGGPQLGGIPWHPTNYEGPNYPIPQGNNSPFSPYYDEQAMDDCTFGNNCCGELFFCADCDPDDMTTVLDFAIQNGISDLTKIYMVDDSFINNIINPIQNQTTSKCVDPDTGYPYIRYDMFTLSGWTYNAQQLPGQNQFSWAVESDSGIGDYFGENSFTYGQGWTITDMGNFDGLTNSLNGEPYLSNNNVSNSVQFANLYGYQENPDDMIGQGAFTGWGDYNGGLFGILEWLGIDTSLINSWQDLVDAFDEGGQSGNVTGLCQAGGANNYCTYHTCYCATPCVNEDGSPCQHDGCTDPEAWNFDEFATDDDGSCEYPESGYMCCLDYVNYDYGVANTEAGSPCEIIQANSWNPPVGYGTQFYSDQGCIFIENFQGPSELLSPTMEDCTGNCAPWGHFCTNTLTESDLYQSQIEWYTQDFFVDNNIGGPSQINTYFWAGGEGFDIQQGGCVYAPDLNNSSYTYQFTDEELYNQNWVNGYGSYFQYGSNWGNFGLSLISQAGMPVFGSAEECAAQCEPFPSEVPGCTNYSATNWNPLATVDDGSCDILGCMDPLAENYSPDATTQPTPEENYELETGNEWPPQYMGSWEWGPCEYLSYSCFAAYAVNYPETYQSIVDNNSGENATEYANGPCIQNYNPPGTPGPIGGMSYATMEECLAQVESQGCVYMDGYLGCTDPEALNYLETAIDDDGSCIYPIEGCTDSEAYNYNEDANVEDNSCEYLGCMDASSGPNPDINGNATDGLECTFPCEDSESNMFIGYNAVNYDPVATTDPNSDQCEYISGCMDEAALNFDPYAFMPTNEDCEYPETSFICTPSDSIMGGTCQEVTAPAGSTFEWGFGEELITYATLEECNENCEEKGKILKCWKCEKGFPVMQQFTSIEEKVSEPGEYSYSVDKGCPKGWEEAPDPWPYNASNNPCKEESDDERPGDEELEPLDGTTSPGTGDDTIVGGGPFFCPADSGNFPWPGCCIQAGIDYSSILTQYPEAPNWLQTYFDSPVGQTYSSNVECNANSGCGENMLPSGNGNCAGTYTSGPDDEPPGIGTSPDEDNMLKEWLQKRAGIIK